LVIFDASTLILLAKIDLLQMVLTKYKGMIPEIVKEEVEYKEAIDTKVISKQINEGRLIVNKNPNKNKIQHILKDFPLGKGEAAALVIANEKDDVLATDDGLAIKVCKILNIKFVTAIHFLIESGLDRPRALAKLDLLKKYGRYSIKITSDAEKRIIGR